LWERGWIDVNKLEKYTIEISKDENRDILEGGEQWSLKYLMATFKDFVGQLTAALQHVGQVLGVSVLITPKFHAKMAGKGIEYIWAVTKSVYHKMPLESKKGMDSFEALVSECTSRGRCSQNRVCAKAFKTSKSIHMCIFHSSATTTEQQQFACTHLASHRPSHEDFQNPSS
jgi:predicted transcriptional regulator